MRRPPALPLVILALVGASLPDAHAVLFEEVSGPHDGQVGAIVRDDATGTLYASGIGAGIFRSTDDGDSWSAVAGNAALGAEPMVTALGVDPSTSPGTLYAAGTGPTGEVYRSFDRGDTLVPFDAGLPAGFRPRAFAFKQATGATYLALTSGSPGLYRLPAGAPAWVACGTGLTQAHAVAVDGGSGDIYVTSRATRSVHRSTDDGATFTATPSGPLPTDGGNTLLDALAVDGSIVPPVLYVGVKQIYDLVACGEVAAGGLFRSTDRGASWTPGGPMNVGALDVDAAGTLFVGTSATDTTSAYGVLHRSTDRGATLTPLTAAPIGDAAGVSHVRCAAGGLLLVGADGVYRSRDGGASFAHLARRGLTVPRRSSALAMKGDGTIFSATTAYGVSRSTDLGATWTKANGSGATRIASLYVTSLMVEPGSQALYATTGTCNPVGNGLWRSTDDGATWSRVAGYAAGRLALALTAAGNGNVAAGGMYSSPGGVFLSTDGGATCAQRPCPGGTPCDPVYALGTNPVNGDLYAGSENRGAWRSTDDGLNWAQIPGAGSNCIGPGMLTNVWAIGFNAAGHVFFGNNHGLWRSDDDGATVRGLDVAEGLGSCNWANGFALATDATGAVYYVEYSSLGAGKTTLYRSTDAGGSWAPFESGLPADKRWTSAIAVNPRDGKLYYGAGGTLPVWAENLRLYRTILPVQPPGGSSGRQIVAGAGLGPPSPNRVRVFRQGGSATPTDFLAYQAGTWGVNVAGGRIDGGSTDRILTGAGPGAVHGPQVRGFQPDGAAVGKVNFYAYGTLRYGVGVVAADVEDDGFDEIVTGAGPGAVFGPHVRAFDHDGTAVTPLAKINFFAYGTLKHGAEVGGGDLEGDAFDEILTGPGPGAAFSPQVRGFDYDGTSLRALAKVNFDAFAAGRQGADVAGGDADGDGRAEIGATPGPAPGNPSRFAGFDYDGNAIAALPGFDALLPVSTTYGGRIGLGDVTGEGSAELLAGAGRDPAANAVVRPYVYASQALTPLVTFDPFPGGAFGVNVASGELGL